MATTGAGSARGSPDVKRQRAIAAVVYDLAGNAVGSLGAIDYPEVVLGAVVPPEPNEACECGGSCAGKGACRCAAAPEASRQLAGHASQLDRAAEDPEIANWKALSQVVYGARYYGRASMANTLLEHTANRFPASEFSLLYRIWIADNLCFDGRYRLAIEAVQELLKGGGDPTFAGVDLRGYAYDVASTAATALGEIEYAAFCVQQAIAARTASHQETASRWIDLGGMFVAMGDLSKAADAFSRGASANGDSYTRRYAECELDRIGRSTPWVYPTLEELTIALRRALLDKDGRALMSLASGTHFSFGVQGGHFDLAGRDRVLPQMIDDLNRSEEVDVRPGSLGAGRKRYLDSWGWRGCVFDIRCLLMVRQVRGGWEWSGITSVGDRAIEFAEQLSGPRENLTNHPLELAIKAPWPTGVGYQAGGIGIYTTLLSHGPLGWAVIAGIGDRACGFGPGGYYYNNADSHVGKDQFAVDFSRWQRGHPFPANQSQGPVLAVADGYIVDFGGNYHTGSTEGGNFIDQRLVPPDQILLPRLGLPSGTSRLGHVSHAPSVGFPYTAKYLHLDGPGRLTVVNWQWVEQGWVLGMVDDTGSSVHDHLHFEIHDGRLTQTASFYGDSVRLDPIDRDSLGDGSDGTCVVSTNEIRTPLLLCLLLAENGGYAEDVAAAMRACRATLTDPEVPDPNLNPRDFCDYLLERTDNPFFRPLRDLICARFGDEHGRRTPLVHLRPDRATALEEASYPAAPYRIGDP